jgi:uncharacterized protein
MNYLVDVNVWIAISTPGHVHHADALAWFENASDDRLLFCRVTQMGFLRLITNHRVMGVSVLSPAEAWTVFDELMKDARIGFVDEPRNIEAPWREQTRHRTGANFWTDAYLAAFAAVADYTIVSFDRQFAQRKDVAVRVLG